MAKGTGLPQRGVIRVEQGITESLAARAFQRLDAVDQERVLAQVQRLVARGVRTEGKALAKLAAVGAWMAMERRQVQEN